MERPGLGRLAGGDAGPGGPDASGGPCPRGRYQTKVFVRGKADRLAVALLDPMTGKISAGRESLAMP